MQRAAQPFGVEPGEVLKTYYEELLRQFGPQGWWPARTRLEVILGAILTQNTSWQNAARAIFRLQGAGLLRWPRLRQAPLPQLETCVRPAGYFRQKARTIRNFAKWLDEAHQGSLDALFRQPPGLARAQLLGLRGLGPETADAILLYAGKLPFFVADAYTRRILARHNLISPGDGYPETQQFLHRHLPVDEGLFNEFHALLVEAGKRHCKRQAPDCHGCPLEPYLPPNGNSPRAPLRNAGRSRNHTQAYTRKEVHVIADVAQ
ncbi:MAG: endonuclease III domain-containing protein [Acidobacteria bacterium]|nr:MAG: endonuclease III domain-containing protein [Acidobacteriota bacterium]